MDNTCTVYNVVHNKQSIYYIVCVFCATSVFYLIKSVLQDLPKLILIQDSFHKFRSFTLLDLELEHTLQKHCTGGTCYTNLHFTVTSICLINDIRSNSSHTVVFAGTFLGRKYFCRPVSPRRGETCQHWLHLSSLIKTVSDDFHNIAQPP